MTMKETKTPVGICGFLKRDYLDDPDIGFAVLPDYEGMGIVFETAAASMDYARRELKFETILAITTEKNTRSRKLLEKLGMREQGTVIPPGDQQQELLLYST